MNNPLKALLAASVAANIFLGAYLAGQHSMRPPFPGFPSHERRMHQKFDMLSQIFTPEEQEENRRKSEENFKQLKEAGARFADLLEQGPVTKEQADEHTKILRNLMDNHRDYMINRVTDRIPELDEEQRAEFARFLREGPPRPPEMGFAPPRDKGRPAPPSDIE